MKVLITGGAGYIGSTICSALEDHGHTPVILDSLVTGREEFTRGRIFYQADIANAAPWSASSASIPISTPPSTALRLIVVPESVAQPLRVLPRERRQIAGALPHPPAPGHGRRGLQLLRLDLRRRARLHGHRRLAAQTEQPLCAHQVHDGNDPAGFLRAYDMHGIALRYFNPIGADPKMRSGIHMSKPLARAGQAGGYGAGQAAGVRDHRHGLAHPRRHGHPRLHPRLGPGQAHVQAVEQFDQVFERLGDPDSATW